MPVSNYIYRPWYFNPVKAALKLLHFDHIAIWLVSLNKQCNMSHLSQMDSIISNEMCGQNDIHVIRPPKQNQKILEISNRLDICKETKIELMLHVDELSLGIEISDTNWEDWLLLIFLLFSLSLLHNLKHACFLTFSFL